jgi:hypothetical protein
MPAVSAPSHVCGRIPPTLQKWYQVADEEAMEAVVLQPRRLRQVPG